MITTHPHLSPLRLFLLSACGLSLPLGCIGKGDDSGDDSGTDTGTSFVGCEGEVEILDAEGVSTGYVRCDDGAVNRVAPRTWDPTIDAARCTGEEIDRSCETDADCTDSPHGACIQYDWIGGVADACGCTYACSTDSDCDTGELCIGKGVQDGILSWSTCVQQSCAVAEDCASGECGLSAWEDGCNMMIELGCRSDVDACRTDGDCPEIPCGLGYGDSDTFMCREDSCTPGRPLRVEGQARTAPVRAGSTDWARELSPSLPLSRKARRELARWWSEIGALEHASVASFSRFALELISIGAPPELLHEAQQAASDEVEHARLAFGLASAYAGEAVGPGPLSLVGLTLSADPSSILRSLIEDACINETLASAEARAAAEGCADPLVREVLLRIAEDEARHAALGWRCLTWLLGAHPELVAEAGHVFGQLEARFEARVIEPGPDLASLGLPSAAARQEVQRLALREVVRPCAEAVLTRRVQLAA